MSSEPPPTYSLGLPHDFPDHRPAPAIEPEIIIIPIGNDVSFQRGYLGANGERAAIEGELQLKSADSFRWEKVFVVLPTFSQMARLTAGICLRIMSLRTVETAFETEIELSASQATLHSSSSEGPSLRSSFLFAIPLPLDTPQCIHTSRSSLSHTLTARVYAPGSVSPALSKSVVVHTRRYSSHQHACPISPVKRTLEDPTHISIEVPRTTFKAGEPVPIYVTVPVPRRELVVEHGLRIRNIRAELVRLVQVKDKEEGDLNFGANVDFDMPPGGARRDGHHDASSSAVQKSDMQPSSSTDVGLRPISGVRGEQKTVSLSGASCRLHPTRPLRVRLVLHSVADSPIGLPTQDLSPTAEHYTSEDIECASITQTTLLHAVLFRLRVRIAFMNMSSRTEHISSVSFPIVILPPSAPLPEIEESMHNAYHKKHDRPPTRTVRMDDCDVPQYEEGEAGPSFLSGAPPPFEEREAPPPFFSSELEASSSSRLPTFQESEREIYVPSSEDPSIDPPPSLGSEWAFEGEGTLFGFPASEQFDGYADMDRSFTPPPTVEMASRDTDVTGLANMNADAAIEALGLALGLESSAETIEDGPPPPPPPMDDPSDPPPSIDSAFRGPQGHRHTPSPHPGQPHGLTSNSIADQIAHPLSAPPTDTDGSHGHAPPPYRVPDGEAGQDHGTGPPPYVDLVHHPQS
ncbi:uncharacterized protein FIBRA_02968 [Fibroporia radiculosa]|uniref:Uncharacterized protein n=1 Tax=Fibroporia radiculosa TaxID=599839 RepID=J4HVQ5_9APHY|nr:uncharacterized protein FIBRA_02968 [Fibroporia radiculosa]CCM00922.1 predicted protein [Fibroporia radiculosa]